MSVNRFALLAIASALLVLACGFPTTVLAQSPLASFDFETEASDAWSRTNTVPIPDGMALGPFNNRSRDVPGRVELELDGVPAGAELMVRFDLVLFGRLDSAGNQADAFFVRTESGDELLHLGVFPCKDLPDDAELMPSDAPNTTRIGNRHLASCTLPQTVIVPASATKDGRLHLVFDATLTGRRSEFWGLDNVTVSRN